MATTEENCTQTDCPTHGHLSVKGTYSYRLGERWKGRGVLKTGEPAVAQTQGSRYFVICGLIWQTIRAGSMALQISQ